MAILISNTGNNSDSISIINNNNRSNYNKTMTIKLLKRDQERKKQNVSKESRK